MRRAALAYLAAWDARQGQVTGRCEDTTGIEPFARLVEQVMTAEPYASADRVFWITDNGSSHRGQAAIDRTASKPLKARLAFFRSHSRAPLRVHVVSTFSLLWTTGHLHRVPKQIEKQRRQAPLPSIRRPARGLPSSLVRGRGPGSSPPEAPARAVRRAGRPPP
jgi:hypothetical protein